MKRSIYIILLLVCLGAGGWWFSNSQSNVRDAIDQYVGNGELLTFKARYTADQIMEKQRHTLLADNQHTFREPVVKFYPYLLIETKYAYPDKKTREGIMLWGLVDGEIVLDTESWEQTHGFEDAIVANASTNDFKVMKALAKHQKGLTRDQLQNELHLDEETLNPWLNSARQKQLVVLTGDEFQLHFQDPKILVYPQTKIKEDFVTKPYHYSQCVSRKYSRGQVEKTAEAAFGSALTLRNVSEVFLPVHCLEVLNPDGSVLTSYWNALTGQRIQRPAA